ncbi:MAG: hypothetical protein ACJ8BC_09265 [Gemmatimonadales bacterium]
MTIIRASSTVDLATRRQGHDDALTSTTPRDAARTAAAMVLAVAEFVGSYER